MNTLTLPHQTSETIRVRVSAWDEGVMIDPRTYPVWWAIMDGAEDPGDDDWHAAGWEASGPPYWTRYRVEDLAPGSYLVWIKVEAEAETPVRTVGRLQMTGITTAA